MLFNKYRYIMYYIDFSCVKLLTQIRKATWICCYISATERRDRSDRYKTGNCTVVIKLSN